MGIVFFFPLYELESELDRFKSLSWNRKSESEGVVILSLSDSKSESVAFRDWSPSRESELYFIQFWSRSMSRRV